MVVNGFSAVFHFCQFPDKGEEDKFFLFHMTGEFAGRFMKDCLYFMKLRMRVSMNCLYFFQIPVNQRQVFVYVPVMGLFDVIGQGVQRPGPEETGSAAGRERGW